jgi:hypothetical protein
MRTVLFTLLLATAAMPAAATGPAAPGRLLLAHAEQPPPVTREEVEARKREVRQDERRLRGQEERRRKQRGAGPFSISLGLNGSSVTASDKNCLGGQGALTFGSRVLLLRVAASKVTYEADDDTDTCDGLATGDASANDQAVMAGFRLPQSGLFVVAGPAAVDVEYTEFGPWGGDTGSRIELGWNSRLHSGHPAGVEIYGFMVDSEVRDYHGIALNVTFGPRR